ncbi:stigma-specific STIG1 family protein [Tanacetum coccineum]
MPVGLVLDELDMCYSSTLYEFDMYYNSALYKSDMCYSSALYELDMCNSSTICGLKYVKGNGGRGVKEKDGVAQSAKEKSEAIKDAVAPSVMVESGTGTQEANSIKADHINLHDENVGKTPKTLTGNTPESIRAISAQFANMVYGFFLGNRVAYPVVANYVRNTGVNMDRCKLIKEDVGNVPVWVNLHGVPMTAFSKDGLSAIATKLGTPLMLDSYTSDMCNQSWGRSSYARAMIEVRADVELKDTILADMPKLTGEGFSTCNFHDECPKNIDSGRAKNVKKPSQAPRGVLVGPKVGFKPTKQTFRVVPKQTNANTSGGKKKDVELPKEVSNLNPFDVLNSVDDDLGTNGGSSNLASKNANSSGSSFCNVGSSSLITTPIVEKIDKIEKLIIDRQVTLLDDDGKPVEKVDYLGDHDGEDDVASTANDIANFMASEKEYYGDNSLLEQWRDSY